MDINTCLYVLNPFIGTPVFSKTYVS